MASEDLKKLREKGLSGLQKELKKKRQELANLYLKLENNQLSDTNLIKKTKKEIARILTIIHEKEKV